MFGDKAANSRVNDIARVIDETITAALHLHDVTGASPYKFFLSHPMKANHNIIDQGKHGQTHEFYLASPALDLHIMAHDGTSHFIIVMPQGEFIGATIQASQKSRYLVRMERPLSQPIGKLARRLLDCFVDKYDAVDTTV